MAQLRAKQIKLSNPGDLLIGGAQGNGTVLPTGSTGQVLKVLAGGLSYADNTAADIAFTPAGSIEATTVQAAVAEVATDAAAALATAEAALDTRLDATESDIVDLQTELDATQAGAGLGPNGAYDATTADAGFYITETTSLMDAILSLDSAANDISNELADAIGGVDTGLTNLGTLQTELNSTQAGAGLAADGSYGTNTGTNYLDTATTLKGADALLDLAIKAVADDLAELITDNTGDLADIQAEVDAIENAVGLNGDGTYAAPAGTEYVGGATSVMGAIVALDTALEAVDVAYKAADTALDGRLTTAETNIADAQEDILTITSSAGLGNGGIWPLMYGNAILDSASPTTGITATTLRGADIRLAEEIQGVQAELVTIVNTATTLRSDLNDEIAARIAADGNLSALTDGIILGTGLGLDGAYNTEAVTNYLGDATSLFEADLELDSAIKGLADELALLQGGGAGTSLASLQTEVDNIEAGLGFGADGVKPNFTSTNVINANDSVVDAIFFLDEHAGFVDTEILRLDTRIDSLGAAFNYVGVLGGVGYEAFAGGIDGASATDLNGLPTGEKDPGDYFKVSSDGFFKVGAAGTPFFVKANDGIVWNTDGNVDVIDNTNSNVIAGTNISVTGSTDAGFTVSLDGIVPVANGGTGKAALEDVTAGSSKITLGAGATGSVVNAFSIDVVPSEILFSTLGQVGTPVDGRFLRWNGTSSTIEYVTAAQLGATVRVEEDFAPSTAVDATVSLANTPVGDIQVFVNGIKLKKAGYSVTGLNVTLNDAANGYGIETGDTLSVSYSRAA